VIEFFSNFIWVQLQLQRVNLDIPSEWLALVLRTQEVLGSILCPETEHPNRIYMVSVNRRQILGKYLKTDMTVSLHILPN
jgi:hypothetical protein